MRIVVFTSNAMRHKYVANTLAKCADETLVIAECKKSDEPLQAAETPQSKSFADRYATEQKFFAGNDTFHSTSLPIEYKEVNLPHVSRIVRDFKPDMGLVFGASIIREPLLSLIPKGKFINLHLGLSPYYRGSGTNFWPFVNEELEYVGATLLHIDSGVDTGDIVGHVRPIIERSDTLHNIGCKTIAAGAEGLVACMKKVNEGHELARVPQWEVPNAKYYRAADITDDVIAACNEKIANGLVEQYLKKEPSSLRLIELS